MCTSHLASFPGLHTQLLSLAVWKAGEGLDGFISRGWCHVQSAHAWVCSLPFTLFPRIQFVLSVHFVLQVRLLLYRSWLATVRDISRSMYHVINPPRPSPAFRTASDKSWARRLGNKATSHHAWVCLHGPTNNDSCRSTSDTTNGNCQAYMAKWCHTASLNTSVSNS